MSVDRQHMKSLCIGSSSLGNQIGTPGRSPHRFNIAGLEKSGKPDGAEPWCGFLYRDYRFVGVAMGSAAIAWAHLGCLLGRSHRSWEPHDRAKAGLLRWMVNPQGPEPSADRAIAPNSFFGQLGDRECDRTAMARRFRSHLVCFRIVGCWFTLRNRRAPRRSRSPACRHPVRLRVRPGRPERAPRLPRRKATRQQ